MIKNFKCEGAKLFINLYVLVKLITIVTVGLYNQIQPNTVTLLFDRK